MSVTNIDKIMARSLRSLAGFCRGEYMDFDPEIIFLQLLLIIKIFSPPGACNMPYSGIRDIPRSPRFLIICSFCNFALFHDDGKYYKIMIFTIDQILIFFCKIDKNHLFDPEKIKLIF